jgi:DNA-binding IclR family transcriptional regulator
MAQNRVEAVERALAMLDAFAPEKRALTLTELAQATQLYKSTVLRLAGSLQRFGYLVRRDDGRFVLGPTAGRLGAAYRAGLDLADIIRPELLRLVTATGETASFYIRDGNERVCLYRQNSPHAARHHLDEGVRLPMNAGASARVLAAYTGRGARNAAIRAAGHYVSLGERDPLLAAVAVPVSDGTGAFVGALSVSGLIARFDERGRARALQSLYASAQALRGTLV